MEISIQSDDEPEFIGQVELVVKGILHRYSPVSIALIKIDNWFGRRWLYFSGKALGAVGVWQVPTDRRPNNFLRIPPFVPERVVSQRRFIAPDYREIDPGKLLHRHVPSGIALERRAAEQEPKTALVWYSGNSMANGRGALMVYVPVDESYWPWYAELKRAEPWRITAQAKNIKSDQFSGLVEDGSASLASSLAR
jgi:hypothetical protein